MSEERDEQEEREEKGFVVIDRRGAGAADEEPAAPEDRAAAAPGSPPPRPDPAPPKAGPPPADFAMLVQPFFVTALFHMGVAPDPETGLPGERNLPLARLNIDILEVIERKTRGNLDTEERQLLEGVLYELRMRFVEAGKAPGE